MKNKIKFYTFFLSLILSFSASSAEITAINFNGDVIGKVIPDGQVVSLKNEIIGKINADSMIVDDRDDIIGGVVPQGVAIGNDFRVLGRVGNDGLIRSSTGKVVGKSLPSSLVVNDSFEVIGAVLFPGLIYSDSGAYIGRLSGDGLYTNIKGQSIGYITPDGFAYKKVGEEYLLDGKLISSKMVVSFSGDVIGSIAPGGVVSSFDGQVLGQIRANGFVYKEDNSIIGQAVSSGYAFDNFGRFLGVINYNGEVFNKGNLVGKISFNSKIINQEGLEIGFAVDATATATDFRGQYFGRISPDGSILRAKEAVGKIGAKGRVFDLNGGLVGQLILSGPVFDYKADIVAHALFGGVVANSGGSNIGLIKGEQVFDGSGKILGATQKNKVILSSSNNILGVSGINGKIVGNNEGHNISPYGYVFSQAGNIIGQALAMSSVYNSSGALVGSITPDGQALSRRATTLGKVMGLGFVVDERNTPVAQSYNPQYALSIQGLLGGMLTENNLIINNEYKIEAKVLPDTSVISSNSDDSVNMMPQLGGAYNQILAIGYDGSLLGYVDIDGKLKDFSNNNIGYVVENGIILNNNNSPIGEIVAFGGVVDEKCLVIGGITGRGEVKNIRNVLIGNILPNRQVFAQGGLIVGYSPLQSSIVDYNGNITAYVSANGHAFTYNQESLGCINQRQTLSKDLGVVGKSLSFGSVMSFDNKIIGRNILDAKIVNDSNQTIGYLQPNNNASSKTGEPLGLLFNYRYAFDNKNNFMGIINSRGEVLNNKEVVGQSLYDGSVVFDKRIVGYALYDMYMYDEDFKAIGYITFDGSVLSFNGQALGSIQKGFLVDKAEKVIGRGNRDYFIRSESNIVVGDLKFNGDLLNAGGKLLGVLAKSGEILDSSGGVVAVAKPLQYYNVLAQSLARKVIVDEAGNVIGYVDEFDNVYNLNGELIGQKNQEGVYVDKFNKPLGRLLDKEKVYDSNGNLIGFTNPDGTVVDIDGKIIGKLNEKGEVVSPNGNIIGGIGQNWYEKVIVEKRQKEESSLSFGTDKTADAAGYRKSLSIALTPDGKYLGEILEDGSVVDKNGKVLGHRQPDGLIMDSQGTLIGIEETGKKKSIDDVFVPAGSFGKGSAYGIGTGPGENLGAGGGFGPGERYDPQRAAALKQAQDQRRQNISVGGGQPSSYSVSSFDGMQKNWDVPSELSSWRVDMSEMILADKPIPAVLARSIYSTGTEVPVTAYVERNIYSEEGRNIIIPAGSRVIGKVGSFKGSGEASSSSAKVDITWERLLRPDGSMFKLDGSITGDAQGRQGALGYLDQQLGKKYTMPVVTSLLTSGTSYIMAPPGDGPESENGSESPRQQAANDARQNFIDSMNQIFEQILADKQNIKAVTFIPAGTRMIIYPKKDLWLRNAERDKDEAINASSGGKATALINPAAPGGNIQTAAEKGVSSGNNVGSGGAIVYSNDTGGVSPEQNQGGRPLIGSSTTQKTQQPQQRVAPPPPPSSGAMSKPNNKTSSSDSAPQLF